MRGWAGVWGLVLWGCAAVQAPGASRAPGSVAPPQPAASSAAPVAPSASSNPPAVVRLQPAHKEPYCDWKGVDAAAVDAANHALELSDAERARALSTHLPFGVPPPRSSRQPLRVLREFVIRYDTDLRGPIWTAYRLGPGDILEAERRDAFRADPFLPEDARATCRDYEEPIFDIGHLVPRADMNRSASAMLNTFLLSNMTPQHCATNRGPWLVLEDLVRQWAAAGPVLVYSGALYDWYPPEGEDPPAQVPRMLSPRYPAEQGEVRRVAVPSHLFKIVLRLNPGGTEGPHAVIALLMRNAPLKVPKTKLKRYLESAIVSARRLQVLTGIEFFPRPHSDAPATEVALLDAQPATLWEYDRLASQLSGRCKDSYPEY